MDWNLYQDETLERRILLDFGEGVMLTQADIAESGIEYEECVNTGEDFSIGTASAASLKFELLNHGQDIPELTGREFIWHSGIQTARQRDEKAARATRAAVICRNGNTLFAGYANPPYLRTWELADGSYVRQDNPAQPELPVKAIFIEGGFLYCIHSVPPYLTVYSLADMSMQPSPELSDFSVARLLRFAEKHTCFNRQDNIITEYTAEYYDGKPAAIVSTVFEYGQAGIFRAEKPEKKNDTILSISTFDRMTYFDADISRWLNGLSYPLTAKAFLQGLCAQCGVELANNSFLNDDFSIRHNLSAEGVTGRQALQWVAELAASFARMTADGKLELAWYTTAEYSLSPHELWSVTTAEYRTDKIDKLQVRSTETDIGVVIPPDEAGDNAYIIENNPLFYAEQDIEIRPAAEKIFDAIKSFCYTPFELEAVSCPFLRAGSIVAVSTFKGDFQAFLMERRTSGNKDSLSAEGNRRRTVKSDAVNQQITKLRGKTNELDRSIEETKSTLTDTAENLQSQISQQAGEISLKVSKDNVISEINASPETIRIQANKVAITGFVTFDDLSTAGSTTINGSNIQTGSISANRISGGTLEGVTVISDGYNGTVEISNGTIYFDNGWSAYINGGAGDMTIGADAGDILFYTGEGSGRIAMSISHTGAVRTYGNLSVSGNLGVFGAKDCIQLTEHYGHRLINAYETAEYYFGDIGEGSISGGKCRVEIDPVFSECVNTNVPYQVFLTSYGAGQIFVSERTPDYFVVSGDDIPFGWELKAKRRGSETVRLKEYLEQEERI